MTKPKPLGIKVHHAASDALMDMNVISRLTRDMMKACGDPSALLTLLASQQEYIESARSKLRTVTENTGRGKSEQYQ